MAEFVVAEGGVGGSGPFEFPLTLEAADLSLSVILRGDFARVEVTGAKGTASGKVGSDRRSGEPDSGLPEEDEVDDQKRFFFSWRVFVSEGIGLLDRLPGSLSLAVVLPSSER